MLQEKFKVKSQIVPDAFRLHPSILNSDFYPSAEEETLSYLVFLI